jgi:hypothetical protein
MSQADIVFSDGKNSWMPDPVPMVRSKPNYEDDSMVVFKSEPVLKDYEFELEPMECDDDKPVFIRLGSMPANIKIESNDKRAKQGEDAKERGAELERQGHKCVRYLQSIPLQISWCMETPCKHSK